MAARKNPRKAAKKTEAGSKAASKSRGARQGGGRAKGTNARPGRIADPPVAQPVDSPGVVTAVTGMIHAWEDDPMASPGRPPLPQPAPTLPTGALAIRIVDAAPPAQIHPIGTSRFRYWTAAETLTRGVAFWSRLLPTGTRWAVPGGTLLVHLDFGEALNAFYRRGASRLEFFHSTVGGRTVFSGESPNIVAHELGHAVLDALRPQLFNMMSAEVAAFHESFGDISAILTGLQLESVRQAVLAETGGRLYRSTFLSRVAEELGWGIRQINAQAVDPDCLRNAVNSFFYRDPSTLPTSGPASSLSSAPHSFSRVFTAAFYDALASMVVTDAPTPTPQSLQKVTRDAGRLLVDAIVNAPIVPNYFSQIAAQMISADQTRFSRKYRDALKGAFIRHGILSLEAAAAIVGPPAPVTGLVGLTDTVGAAGGGSNSGGGAADLPPMSISAAAFGLSVSTILCAMPSEGGGYLGAAAAALDTGSITPPRETDAAKSFIEDLFRMGRIDIGSHGDPDAQIGQPLVRKTHVLKGGSANTTLVRETFDCGFD